MTSLLNIGTLRGGIFIGWASKVLISCSTMFVVRIDHLVQQIDPVSQLKGWINWSVLSRLILPMRCLLDCLND